MEQERGDERSEQMHWEYLAQKVAEVQGDLETHAAGLFMDVDVRFMWNRHIIALENLRRDIEERKLQKEVA